MSARRVRQMLNEPDPPPQDPITRQFPPRAVGEWLRARFIAERCQPFDYDAEKARLTHHQANLSALEEAGKRRDLIPADVVESRWQLLSDRVRTRLLAFPAPAAAAVAGMESAQEAERTLRALVYQALRELANPTDDAKPGETEEA
ncbi:hypothetical protein [Methylococcus sp. Mc7]|uniref:hypothetical protein n=1 Tax=Methylococcus sp. Mc7 TaxID=2860258 RepID=UPI001C52BE35|nr:hypothetical protein [Methylococcus sp. Mc7]QXP83008.1 hypothetical protein KW115_12465 [Methylococcus sp. Mc7]